MASTTYTLHEDICTFMITSRSIRLKTRNVSDKNRRENQNTHFMFNTFFSPKKIMPFTRYCVKTVFSKTGHR